MPSRLAVALASAAVVSAVHLPTRGAQRQAAGLTIVVIAGEDAVNIVQQRTAVAPVVEVRDRNDTPVAGVLVTFSIQGGQNASFGGGLQTLTLTTNAAGRAAVTSLTPTASGALQINVAASFQGQTATATIAQTNFATAAQAAQGGAGGTAGSSGASAGGGGGLGPVAISSIAGGAVGGLYAYRKIVWGPDPRVDLVSTSPSIALLGAVVIFGWSGNTGGGNEWTETWDWGDGTSDRFPGGPSAQHAFTRTGVFTVTVTIEDPHGRTAAGSTTVTVKTLDGRWTLGTTTSVFDFTQSGLNIGGQFTTATGVGSGTVTGLVEATIFARVTFTITPIAGTAASSFVGFARFEAGGDVIGGTFSGGISATTELRRQ